MQQETLLPAQQTTETVPKVSKYKRYYDKHKDDILKRSRERYALNREVLKQKVLERYYKNKALKSPADA